jgi:hypothetical protein
MSTPRLFGGCKSSARRNEPSAFFQRDEARRRFLQSNLFPGFAERIAQRIGESAAWVYRRVEGKAPISAELQIELLTEVPPEQAVRRLREDAARLGFAVAEIPGARGIQAAPVSQLAEALRLQARAAEAAINALVDSIVTPEEAEAVRVDADAATVLTINAVATLEVAAGTRLLG